jgi:PAS domain S-box-containing protein
VGLTTRLAVAMIALVLLTATAVGLLSYRGLEEAVLPRALERTETHTRLLASGLESYARGAGGDVLAFRSATALEGMVRSHLAGGVDPVDGTTEETWRERMATRYAAELASKPAYSQFRIIGIENSGREIVRVDRSGPDNAVRIVPDSELQSQGNRGYFREAIAFSAGNVYVSPINLNQENGIIETPYVPTLHVAAPILTREGKPFGIVIINVDMRPEFERLRSLWSGGQLFVVNQRGDYLLHSDSAKTFGFDLGGPMHWQDDFPDFAAIVGSKEAASGLVRDAAGSRGVAAFVAVRLAGGPPVGVIEMVPNAIIMAPARTVQRSSLIAGAAAVLFAGLLAILLARSLTMPIVQMTRAVEGFMGEGRAAVPIHAAGEIGVLARAFDRMTTEIREKTAARMASEAALRDYAERERLFIAAVESSQDAIITKALDGTITSWNYAAEQLFGYSAQEAIGKSIFMIVPAERQEEVREILARLRKGETIEHHETVRIAKDGRRIDFSLSVSPVKSTTGVLIGAAKVARDITESKRAQEAFRREVEERQNLFEILSNTITSMVDAVLIADVDGRVVHSNPAAERLMGIVSGVGPLDWARPNEVFKPDGISPIPLDGRPLMRAIRGEAVDNMEIVVRHKAQNKSYQVVANGGPIRDSSNRVTGAVVVYRDVSQAMETERQLRQAQKMEAVGELTGGIAHDFNNILTVITGTIEILAEAVADTASLAAVAKMIDEAAMRGTDLTQRLLAFARRQPLQPRETNVNALVIETAKLLRPTLGEQIEIESMLQDDLAAALVDANQLTTALINLALNSRDAMPEGGKLTLETHDVELDEFYAKANSEVQPGSYVLIAVSDSGSGIPEAIRDKVFEPFFTTKDVGRGTGLGLSMVYGFVKQSGGHIKIYSEEGHGTTIKLYLPRSQSLGRVADEAPVVPVEGGSETILVVEDDTLVRNYVVTQLRSLNYEIVTAANAAEALVTINSGAHLDLLFTDVVMPGPMNGRQLVDEALKRRPLLKVLFTSGYTENAIVHHGRLDPGVLLLAKPYRKSDLARMIRQAIGTRTHPA